MKPHWQVMSELCRYLMWTVKKYDKRGVDLHFTVSNEKHINSKKSRKLASHLVNKPRPAGCDMGARLGKILDVYADTMRNYRNARAGRKKRASIEKGSLKELSVYVLTDGLWQEQSDVKGPIEALVATMIELKYPRRQVGIQFIRFGDDPRAIEKLRCLDDGLNLPMYVTLPS